MDRSGNHILSMARLAKDVLAEIPEQFLSYMRARGIKPSPAPPPYTPPTHVLQTQIWLRPDADVHHACPDADVHHTSDNCWAWAFHLVLRYEPGKETFSQLGFSSSRKWAFLDPKPILFLNQNCKYGGCMSNRKKKIVQNAWSKVEMSSLIFRYFCFVLNRIANFQCIIGKKHKLHF